jgi:hypothetical protein
MKLVFKQRGTYDCALCSVAMALETPPEILFTPERFALAEEKKSTAPSDLLNELGYEANKDYWLVYVGSCDAKGNMMQLLNGRKVILQVQSLNHRKAQHIVYWDGEELHDPSNKQIYHWIEQCAPSVQHVVIFREGI